MCDISFFVMAAVWQQLGIKPPCANCRRVHPYNLVTLGLGPGSIWARAQFPDTRDRFPDTRDRFPDTRDRFPDRRDRYLDTRDRYPDTRVHMGRAHIMGPGPYYGPEPILWARAHNMGRIRK